jgi:hypothetical protein
LDGLPFHCVLGDLGCEARRCAQVGDLVVKPWAGCAGQQHEGAIGDGDDGDRVAA